MLSNRREGVHFTTLSPRLKKSIVLEDGMLEFVDVLETSFGDGLLLQRKSFWLVK